LRVSDLGLFAQRTWEWAILDPLVGSSMLELGNKRKADFVFKTFFEGRGFRHVSVDINGLDGAIPLDLRQPLNLGTFDMVTNFGTSEHVSEKDYAGQVQCWRNIVEAMHVGSVLVSVTPMPGHHPRHGVWYPHKEFYRNLAALNGCEVEALYDSDQRPNGAPKGQKHNFARLVRREVVPFQMPTGLFRNIQ
jgi:hypothetical protein